MRSVEALPHVKEPRLRALLAHWLEVRGGREVPRRRDIDALRIPSVLSIVWICDYDRPSGDFRVRLAGDDVLRMYKGDLRGHSVRNLYAPEEQEVVMERMRRVATEPCIVHLSGTIYGFSHHTGQGERLMLPLAGDGAAVESVVGASAYRWDSYRVRGTPTWREMEITFTPISDLPPSTPRNDPAPAA